MVISVDLGTSSCRSAVFSEDLRMLSCASVEYPFSRVSGVQIEQDATVWWESVRTTIKRAVADAPIDPCEITALAISSQGITIVPIDCKGRAMCPAMSWLDTRAIDEENALREHFGAKELFGRTGKRISRSYTLPKLMWLHAHHPQIYTNCWKIMMPLEYIQFCLCGECATDHTMAAGTMFYDVRDRAWMCDLLETLHLDIAKLPQILGAGEPLGTLRPEVAGELGLRKDVLVAVGGQDQKCAAMGAGLSKGLMTASLGTGGCLSLYTDIPILDEEMRIPSFSYLYKDAWVLEGVLNTAASCYQWLRKNFAADMQYEDLNELAVRAGGPSKELFFPNLAGASSPDWQDAIGVFSGLSLGSNLGSVARAVLEGVAYKMRENIEAMRSIAQVPDEIRLFGGGAKSEVWCQIIAEITGMRVTRPASAETGLAGAAMLAENAFRGRMPRPLPVADTFEPDIKMSEAYDEAFRRYESVAKRYFRT